MGKNLYFMLIYSEAIYTQIKTQYKSQIRASLDDCWSFLENKNKTGKELYTLLDDGTDFNGIFIYMQLDEDETNVPSWDNISYAVSSTAKEAYLFDNQKKLPSPLENIDSNLIELFIENLKEINIDFYNHVEEVKNFVQSDSSPSKVDALKELGKLELV